MSICFIYIDPISKALFGQWLTQNNDSSYASYARADNLGIQTDGRMDGCTLFNRNAILKPIRKVSDEMVKSGKGKAQREEKGV